MKTIKKLLTILLIAFATVAGAQNNWYAPSVFHEKVSFKKEVSQTDGSDSLTLRTIGTNSTLNHGLGTLLLNNSKSAIGLFNGTGYRVAATATNIQLQQGATDSILINFSGDTAHVNATVNAWKFTPKLDANSVTGFWGLTGNAGTNPATNFVGTTDGRGVFIRSGLETNAYNANAFFQQPSDSEQGIISMFLLDSLRNGSSAISLTYETIQQDAVNFNGDSSCSTIHSKDSFGIKFTQSATQFSFYPTGLKIADGTQGAGKVLTSDAAGLTSFVALSASDYTGIPAYANNAAAFAVLGAGKLYYTDVAGEYILKVTH